MAATGGESMSQPLEERRYFEARIEHELALARSASHPEAVRAHSLLATLYRDRLGPQGQSGPPESLRA
jgi:hypothetical protein